MIEASGRIPVKIGVAVAPAVKQVNVDEKITTKIHKFADGSRTSSEGQPEYSWTLTCSILKDKQVILALLKEAKARGEVTITLDVGTEQHMLIGCVVSGRTFSSDSDGTADLTISGMAPEWLQTR